MIIDHFDADRDDFITQSEFIEAVSNDINKKIAEALRPENWNVSIYTIFLGRFLYKF